jgi:HPt (histidine-containing phosphotransfer) domain-containing protein
MLRRFGGDREVFEEVIGAFLRSLPELSARVQRAVETQDTHALAAAGHRLRGALLEVAAFPAAELARQLEASVSHADPARGVELWAALSPLLSVLAADLDEHTIKP